MRSAITSLALVATFLPACAVSHAAGPDGAQPDAAVVEDASTCANHIPNPDAGTDPPLGSTVGRSFRGFVLPNCGDIPYEFYGPQYCDPRARFTVVQAVASWCGPCVAQTAAMADVVRTYGPRGVRVVQVLIQDVSHGPASAVACEALIDWLAPDHPFLHTLLYDVDQITSFIYAEGFLPAAVIVDSNGVIRWNQQRGEIGIEAITNALDALLGP